MNRAWSVVAVTCLAACGERGAAKVVEGAGEGTASSGALGGAGPRCPGWGWYCGQAGFGGDATHLYYCSQAGSASTDLGQCGEARCHVASAGTADYCEGGFSNRSNLAYPGYGFWCGGAGTNYPSGASGHLYFFADGLDTDLGPCANGCQVNASGPDFCRASHRPCSFYGGQSEGPDMSKAVYAHIKGLRVGHILPQGHASWDDAAFAPYDAEAALAADAGIQLVGLINNESVPWGNGQAVWNAPPDSTGMNPYVQLFVDNAKAIMTRYAGQIKYWEIWNEPNTCTSSDFLSVCEQDPQHAGGSFIRSDVYAKLLAETYVQNKALISANGLHLTLGGIYAHDVNGNHYVADDYLREVYGNGVWTWMQANEGRRYVWDNFALHIYTTLGGTVSAGTINDYLDRLASVRNANGDRSKVLMTEFGWITSQVSEGTQAANLDTELTVLEGRPEIQSTYVFRLSEWPNPGWGIFRANGTRKPAVDVYWNHTRGCH